MEANQLVVSQNKNVPSDDSFELVLFRVRQHFIECGQILPLLFCHRLGLALNLRCSVLVMQLLGISKEHVHQIEYRRGRQK